MSRARASLLVLALVLLSACGREAAPPAAPTAPVPAAAVHLFDDLGKLHREISSKNADTQR
jgi:hypothetical protein